jgi:protein-glutamine gamma-glutamyltransferase
VMMLRSQGIPARMAIGFKGGEWNSLGMYYQVQQLHAHAWVEVLLERNQIPPNQFAEDEMPRAAWLTLDPTEGTQESNATGQRGGILARFRQYLDYGQVLWTNYVVGLNYRRQRQGIYEPLAQGASAAVDSVVSPQVWQERMRWVSNSPIGAFWAWYRLHWFSWRGGLVAAGFSVLTLGAYAAIRGLAASFRRWGLGARGANHDPPVLEIYRRLEAALAARGLERASGQTAHEFAVMAGGELSEDVEDRRVAHLPRRIIDAFYRVRFGSRTLDNLEVESVEHALSELEHALARPS